MEKKNLRIKDTNWKEDLQKKLNKFQPDLNVLKQAL
jgi:hypothetical protein